MTMVNKRELLATLLSSTGLISPLKWATSKSSAVIPVLAYHGVSAGPGEWFIDDGLKGPELDDFVTQMKYMKDNYELITFRDLQKISSSDPDELARGRRAIVTFDDGFRNNYDVVFPVLSDLGIKATIFLVADNVESGEPFWFERISYLLGTTARTRLNLESLGDRRWSLTGEADRKRAQAEIKSACKGLDERARGEVIEELEGELGSETRSAEMPRIVLSWKEVTEMIEYGFEFGSHTMTHPNLTTAGDRELEYELRESKDLIERRTGREVISFAYPSGLYDSRVRSAVMDAGYRYAAAYNHGLFRYSEDALLDVDRVMVEREFSLPLFKLHLVSPNIRFEEVLGGQKRAEPGK